MERLFAEVQEEILALVPHAQVLHVGGTAIPGGLTKGDLDLQIRVPFEKLEEACSALASRYTPIVPGFGSPTIATFKDTTRDLPLDIHLTPAGGQDDFFWRFRDVLRARPDLAEAYDRLKTNHAERGEDAYVDAKRGFFTRLRRTPEFDATLSREPT